MQSIDDTAYRPKWVDSYIARQWMGVLFVGVIMIAVGAMVVAWPDKTLTVLSVLLGIQLLIVGLFRLVGAFSSEALAPGLTGFAGVLGIIAGVIVMKNPFETVTILAVVLAAVWIASGSIDVIAALADSSLEDRGLIALSGLLSLAAGIVVAAWPAPSITVIAWVAGVYLVMAGLVLCVSAFQLRSAL